MSSSPRRQGSRHSRSRSASNVSFRSAGSSPYRNVGLQTSETGRRSPKRQRLSSPTRSPSPSPSRPAPRKCFGLNIPTNQPRFIGKFDFLDKYPDDPINEEMGPNARVWRAFLDECEVFDADMVTEARDGLDLHLVFAGLFSAVLTTFVAQTSQALSTNFPALSTSLLVEMVALQRAQVSNTPIDTIPSSPTTSGPSGFDVWVNALWFTSLTLSLGTALITVLVKQWLYQYMSMISGTARDRSLIRHYRFEGLQRWHVLVIIGTLPVLLHLALGLFLAGLVVFLIPLNLTLASVIGFITLVIYTMYIISNILPLISTHCPYRTPFSDVLNVLTRRMRMLPSMVRACIHKLFPSFGEAASASPMEAFKTLKEAERVAATGDEVAEEVAFSALLWLSQMTSNPPTKRIILESLGCLSWTVAERFQELNFTEMGTPGEFELYRPDPQRLGCSIIPGQERRTERLLRGPMAAGPGYCWILDSDTFELPFQMVAALLTSAGNFVTVLMESQTWNHNQFLVYLIREHLNNRPIRLPLVLWNRLIYSAYINDVPQLTGIEDDMFLLSLSKLALEKSFLTTPRIIPFSGPVCITHVTVPLFQFTVDLIAARMENICPADSFESEPLTKLFIIHDYAVSCLHLTKGKDGSDAAISVMGNVWEGIRTVKGPSVSENDTRALCQRAENDVLWNLTLEVGWCDTMFCYASILDTYLILCDSHVASPEFFERLISDFCSSLRTFFFPFKSAASSTLQKIIRQPTNISVFCTLFCTSPFLSTHTQALTSLYSSHWYLYPLVADFISSFAVDMPREAALQCMNVLSADPQRLYTICRVIALGDNRLHYSEDREGWEEDIKQHLLKLVCFDPTHAVWTQRVQCMNMDPQDWPYLHLVDGELDDEAKLADVKKRMKVGLAILDEFFVSFNQSSSATPRRSVSPWERIRCFVSGIGRSFRQSPSEMADMELGLQPSGRANRHIDDAPPHTSLPPQNTPSVQPWNSRPSIPSQTSPTEVAPGESVHSEAHYTQMTPHIPPSSSRSNIQTTEQFSNPSSGPFVEHQPSEDVSDASFHSRHITNLGTSVRALESA